MTVVVSRLSVTTSATKIAENTAGVGLADSANLSFVAKNLTASVSIYLAGTNSVTTSNGFEWAPSDGPLSIDLEPGEALWGIVAVTTQSVHVLAGGR